MEYGIKIGPSLQTILIILKIFKVIDWSWGIVLIPLWLFFVWGFAIIIYSCCAIGRIREDETEE